MHILILPSWYPSSPTDVTGIFFRDQSLALLKSGHKVGVISPKFCSIFQSTIIQFPEYELDKELPTYRKKIFSSIPILNYFFYKSAARKLIKKYISIHGKPDIIHAHSVIYAGMIARVLSDEWEIPYVITEHSSVFGQGKLAKWQVNLAELAFKQCSSRIVVSPSLGEDLTKLMPKLKDSWDWIPNMVSNRFDYKDNTHDVNKTFRFLCIGQMIPNKGHQDLIDAFKLYINSGNIAELWMASDGPLRDSLEGYAKKHNLEQHINFLGIVLPEEMPKLMNKAHALVVPSHFETFGIVIAEALVSGLPVISTNCGGPKYLIEPSDGKIVPVKNPEALKEAMVTLASNFYTYDREKLSKRAKSKFSEIAVTQALSTQYQKIIKNI